MDILHSAREVILAEKRGLESLAKNLDQSFEEAINIMMQTKGRVLISGMGKSGLIGRKIAATLSSTGTQSYFIHPAEAYHGDLGMIASNDTVILISYSGETEETIKLLPFLKDNKNKIISITGSSQSTLSTHAHANLDISIDEEVCPLNLAPTTSTTVSLALGDALAICLMKLNNFKEENFARFHPGGSLGRKLLTKVSDIMKDENLPILNSDSELSEIISKITKGKLGISFVCEGKKVIGVITDGDLRRAFDKFQDKITKVTAREIMTKSPKTVLPDQRLVEAEKIMNDYKIGVMVVINNLGELQGALQIYDI